MTVCVRCQRDVRIPCTAANQNSPPGRVVVASDTELLRLAYFRRLAIATANLGMSRRQIPNWMADAVYGYPGCIQWPDGRPFMVPDTLVDGSFNDDGSFRWLSSFMSFAEKSPMQHPQARILHRLRVIDLAFRIDRPDVARHFGR